MILLSFQLTMPNVGSWNGTWTGYRTPYFRTRKVKKEDAEKILNGEEEANFHYSWNDGWGANVRVRQINYSERRKLDRITQGFYGYDWMIDSIIEHQEIQKRTVKS